MGPKPTPWLRPPPGLTSPDLQIYALDPDHPPLGVDDHPGVDLLHHAVIGEEPDRLADLRDPASADDPLEGGDETDPPVQGGEVSIAEKVAGPTRWTVARP